MTILDIILIVFAIFALSRVILRFKDHKVGVGGLIFWACIWIVFIVGLIFRKYFSVLILDLGLGRSMDVILTVTVAVLFYLVFRIYVHLDELKRNITELSQEIAINNRKKKIENKNK